MSTQPRKRLSDVCPASSGLFQSFRRVVGRDVQILGVKLMSKEQIEQEEVKDAPEKAYHVVCQPAESPPFDFASAHTVLARLWDYLIKNPEQLKSWVKIEKRGKAYVWS